MRTLWRSEEFIVLVGQCSSSFGRSRYAIQAGMEEDDGFIGIVGVLFVFVRLFIVNSISRNTFRLSWMQKCKNCKSAIAFSVYLKINIQNEIAVNDIGLRWIILLPDDRHRSRWLRKAIAFQKFLLHDGWLMISVQLHLVGQSLRSKPKRFELSRNAQNALECVRVCRIA